MNFIAKISNTSELIQISAESLKAAEEIAINNASPPCFITINEADSTWNLILGKKGKILLL